MKDKNKEVSNKKCKTCKKDIKENEPINYCIKCKIIYAINVMFYIKKNPNHENMPLKNVKVDNKNDIPKLKE